MTERNTLIYFAGLVYLKPGDARLYQDGFDVFYDSLSKVLPHRAAFAVARLFSIIVTGLRNNTTLSAGFHLAEILNELKSTPQPTVHNINMNHVAAVSLKAIYFTHYTVTAYIFVSPEAFTV